MAFYDLRETEQEDTAPGFEGFEEGPPGLDHPPWWEQPTMPAREPSRKEEIPPEIDNGPL